MYRDVDAHLRAFVMFNLSDARLSTALRAHDFRTYASIYNGPRYAENRYDVKMADAFKRNGGV
jgi:hypothetical protein